MTLTSRAACLSLFAGSVTLALPVAAQVAGPYTPEQVYFVLYDAMRHALGVTNTDLNQKTWLSLSTVGSIVTADDPAHVNDLANFCPDSSPVLATFGREPKLDAVYEKLIEGAVSPVRTYSSAYKKAKAVLLQADGEPSVKLKKYNERHEAYVVAWTVFIQATDPAARTLASMKMNNALQAWTDSGYRSEIDDARNITDQEEFAAGGFRQANRRQILRAYRNTGMTGTDVLGSFRSPVSTFSPDPSKWATATGWVSVSFAADQTLSQYNYAESQRSGFGGLSLGFVHIGGTAGGKRTTEVKVSKVYKFSYQFELMRASINRPWLDTSLLFQPLDWTWKKNAATTVYPYVAVTRDAGGRPLPSPATVYDNKEVGCSLYPVDAVIARNRKIVATVATSDYNSAVSAGSASGGGSLFGIFGGGGKQNWSTTVISQDAVNTTFSVEANGIAVIGLLSQFVPHSPNPNLSDKWPKEAWMPKAGGGL